MYFFVNYVHLSFYFLKQKGFFISICYNFNVFSIFYVFKFSKKLKKTFLTINFIVLWIIFSWYFNVCIVHFYLRNCNWWQTWIYKKCNYHWSYMWEYSSYAFLWISFLSDNWSQSKNATALILKLKSIGWFLSIMSIVNVAAHFLSSLVYLTLKDALWLISKETAPSILFVNQVLLL